MGALTSQPYAFVSRSWELKSIESIDIFDSLGSNVRVDIYNDKVVRVLPSLDEERNEEWISNRTRFSCDGLSIQRIGLPLLRVRLEFWVWKRPIQWLSHIFLRWGRVESYIRPYNVNSCPSWWLYPYQEEFSYGHGEAAVGYCSWFGRGHIESFVKFYARQAHMDFGSAQIVVGWEFGFFYLLTILRCAYLRFCEGVCGFLLEGESIAAFKYFIVGLGSANMMCGAVAYFDIDFKSGYLFNGEVRIIDFTQTVVLVGLNPRLEFPLLNVRLRRGFWRQNQDRGVIKVYSLGLALNYMTYDVENLGNSVRILLGVVEGKSFFCQRLVRSARQGRTLFLLGMGSLLRPDGSSLVRVVSMFCLQEWIGFSIVHETSGRISAMDLGFIPGIHSSFVSSFGGIPFDLPYKSYRLDLMRCSGFSTLPTQLPVTHFVTTNEYVGVFMADAPVPSLRSRFRRGGFGSFVYLLGADDIIDFEYLKLRERVNLCISRWSFVKFYKAFTVYQGHHWEAGAAYSDLVFPSLVFTETEGMYLNYAGESRRSSVVVSSYGEAESDWDIIQALEAAVHWSMSLRVYWEHYVDERGDIRDDDDILTLMRDHRFRQKGYVGLCLLLWLLDLMWDPDPYDESYSLWDWYDIFISRAYYFDMPIYGLESEKHCIYADHLGQESVLLDMRWSLLARGKWFEFELVEKELIGGLLWSRCVYFLVFDMLVFWGWITLEAFHDFISEHLVEYDGEVLEEEDLVTGMERHMYLWRLAPYFRTGEVDDGFFVDWKLIYSPCFLLNSLLGILVDDYSRIDAIGRSSRALSLQAAATWHTDVSFASKGHYWCTIRGNRKR